MKISQEKLDGMTVVHLEGRFDFSARKAFKDTLDSVIAEGHPIVLDLEKVTFVDSSALGMLVICHQNVKNKKVPFSMINPQTYVKQVLDLANIGKMIPIFGSLAEVPKTQGVATGASV